jgi:hypothetical protein
LIVRRYFARARVTVMVASCMFLCGAEPAAAIAQPLRCQADPEWASAQRSNQASFTVTFGIFAFPGPRSGGNVYLSAGDDGYVEYRSIEVHATDPRLRPGDPEGVSCVGRVSPSAVTAIKAAVAKSRVCQGPWARRKGARRREMLGPDKNERVLLTVTRTGAELCDVQMPYKRVWLSTSMKPLRAAVEQMRAEACSGRCPTSAELRVGRKP